MASVYDYTFNSTTRIGDDKCDLSQRNVQNALASTYMLDQFRPACPMTKRSRFRNKPAKCQLQWKPSSGHWWMQYRRKLCTFDEPVVETCVPYQSFSATFRYGALPRTWKEQSSA